MPPLTEVLLLGPHIAELQILLWDCVVVHPLDTNLLANRHHLCLKPPTVARLALHQLTHLWFELVGIGRFCFRSGLGVQDTVTETCKGNLKHKSTNTRESCNHCVFGCLGPYARLVDLRIGRIGVMGPPHLHFLVHRKDFHFVPLGALQHARQQPVLNIRETKQTNTNETLATKTQTITT